MISIDEFRKVELKVATIKSAEPHPNADKLIVLQIELGTEQRQICAGIRNHYTPEELVGKQIVVVQPNAGTGNRRIGAKIVVGQHGIGDIQNSAVGRGESPVGIGE